MSAIKSLIPPELLGKELSELLLGWAENEEKKFFAAIDEAGEACKVTIEEGLYPGHGVRTGAYRNSLRVLNERPRRHCAYATWYSEEPYYRLTHLLENGHATRDGTGRTTSKIKHIKQGRQIAEKVLEERIAGLWGG